MLFGALRVRGPPPASLMVAQNAAKSSLELVFTVGMGLSLARSIPIWTLALRTNLGGFAPSTRYPFMPTAFTAVSLQLDSCHLLLSISLKWMDVKYITKGLTRDLLISIILSGDRK